MEYNSLRVRASKRMGKGLFPAGWSRFVLGTMRPVYEKIELSSRWNTWWVRRFCGFCARCCYIVDAFLAVPGERYKKPVLGVCGDICWELSVIDKQRRLSCYPSLKIRREGTSRRKHILRNTWCWQWNQDCSPDLQWWLSHCWNLQGCARSHKFVECPYQVHLHQDATWKRNLLLHLMTLSGQ